MNQIAFSVCCHVSPRCPKQPKLNKVIETLLIKLMAGLLSGRWHAGRCSRPTCWKRTLWMSGLWGSTTMTMRRSSPPLWIFWLAKLWLASGTGARKLVPKVDPQAAFTRSFQAWNACQWWMGRSSSLNELVPHQDHSIGILEIYCVICMCGCSCVDATMFVFPFYAHVCM